MVFLCSLLAEVLHMDYGYWGVLVIFAFYVCRKSKIAMTCSWLGLILLQYLPRLISTNFYYKNILFATFTFLSIIPILLYNKKQGKKLKYFLYFFYPVHLLLIFGLYHFIN